MSMYGVSGSTCAADRRVRHAVDRVVPPGVAAGRPRRLDGVARAPHDQHAVDRRRRRDGLVRHGLQRHPRPAAEEAVRGDQHGRLAVGEPRRDRRRPVAAEDRRVDRLQPAERQHRDDGLDEHRQEDPDPIARPGRRAPRSRRRGGVDRRGELRVRQPPDLAVLALPDERLAVGVVRGARLGRRAGVVEGAAAPPARPCRSARHVEHLASDGGPRRSRCRRPRHPRTSRDRRRPAPAGPRAIGSPVARRNPASRVASAISGVGRHATPSPSRPKIGIAGSLGPG